MNQISQVLNIDKLRYSTGYSASSSAMELGSYLCSIFPEYRRMVNNNVLKKVEELMLMDKINQYSENLLTDIL